MFVERHSVVEHVAHLRQDLELFLCEPSVVQVIAGECGSNGEPSQRITVLMGLWSALISLLKSNTAELGQEGFPDDLRARGTKPLERMQAS